MSQIRVYVLSQTRVMSQICIYGILLTYIQGKEPGKHKDEMSKNDMITNLVGFLEFH